MRRLAGWLVLAVVGAGCGIDAIGMAESDGGAASSSSTSSSSSSSSGGAGADGGTDTPPVIVACGSTGSTCTSALAAGFKPVALAAEGACPKDFTTLDIVTDAAAGQGACACSCAIDPMDPPSCAKGSFVPNVGSSACSGASNITYEVNGTGCTAVNAGSVVTTAYSQIVQFPLTPGKCTTSATTDPTKVTSKAMRVCTPPPNCEEDVCQGTVPAPLAACVVHDGDVTCPGPPFEKRTVVGTSATLTCTGCATCTNKGTCSPGTFRYYGDTACTQEVATRIADGQCHALTTGTAGGGFQRFRYDVPVTQPRCEATSTPTANVALEATKTVCCR